MANIKSALKRVKISETKSNRNKMIISNLKTTIRNFNNAIENGNKDLANEIFIVATKKIDRATSKGAIHANSAARKKSTLSKKLNAI